MKPLIITFHISEKPNKYELIFSLFLEEYFRTEKDYSLQNLITGLFNFTLIIRKIYSNITKVV